MILTIFKRDKRKRELKKISKPLTSLNEYSIIKKEGVINYFDDMERYRKELSNYIMKQDDLKIIIEKYSANETMILGMFDELRLSGGGQWTNGYYVPAASLGYTDTLKKLLASFDGKIFRVDNYDSSESAIRITMDMIRHFEPM